MSTAREVFIIKYDERPNFRSFSFRAIQILLGHTKIENTVHYLGVDVEDALLLAERTEI